MRLRALAHRQVVDPHAADGPPVVAEVVLDRRVGHLEESMQREQGDRRGNRAGAEQPGTRAGRGAESRLVCECACM